MRSKSLLLGIFIFLLIGKGISQTKEFIIPAFSSIEKVKWRDSIYLFPQFEQGELIFDTGFKASEKKLFNYNIFTERIDAISSKGDTAALEIMALPHTVRMGGHVFHYFPKKGYMRVVEPGKVSLAILEYFSSGYLIESSSGYEGRNTRVPFKVDNRKQPYERDRSYIKQGDLYFIADNKFYHTQKFGLLNAYQEDREVVKLYMDKHPVDFSDQNSLIKLIHSLNELRQTPEEKIPGLFRMKAGDQIKKEWSDSLYLFPQFKQGSYKLTNRNEHVEPTYMNYNLSTSKMDYVSTNGDTLELKSANVPVINFDGQLFYRQKNGEYAEVLLQGPEAFCELKQLKVIQRNENMDLQTTYNKTLSSDDVMYDRLCIIEKSYFFVDNQQRTWSADEVAFLRFFPQGKTQIKNYLISNPVNFNRKSDLMRLLTYCKQL